MIKCSIGLLVRGTDDTACSEDLLKSSEPEIRCFCLYLLTWRRLLIRCQGKLFVLL